VFRIALYQPEIPPNTGNIIRLCANTGCSLHLIEPLGFDMDDRRMRRAGLDYREYAAVHVHGDLQAFLDSEGHPRLLAVSTRGSRPYHSMEFRTGDALLFGPETRGLPEEVLQALPPEQRMRIPMLPGSRSLNLSNATALVAYEGLRQLGFPGLA